MKPVPAMVLVVHLLAPMALSAAVVVTSPSTVDSVSPAPDFATRAFQDPWDMNEQTDLGLWLYGVESPHSGLLNPTFAGGIFSATTANTDPLVFLLDTPVPGTAPVGKTGANFPIDASKYTVLALRMNLGSQSVAQLFWSKTDMYQDVNGAGPIPVYPGWRIYLTKIPLLSQFLGTNPWIGTIRMLRFDPSLVAGDTVQLDWVRLVADDPALKRNITWTGAGTVDIYLDDDANPANGNLGAIAKGVTGGAYNLFVGALPPGDYWVAVAPTGTTSFSYSPGYYHVDGTPTLAFTAPSDEGSADDFATTQLGNPWDMDSLSDLDTYFGISSITATTIPAQNEAGMDLGSIAVLEGTSTAVTPPAPGDPELYFLWSTQRGATHRIDPDRYRILTLELGLPIARDIANGSVARVIWKVAGESVENVSDDLLVNSKSGTPTMDARIIADMKTLPLESDPGGSPSKTGWNPGFDPKPGLDSFRIDPHEFSNATSFHIHKVKLAALERASSSYQIRWTYVPSGTPATVSLYYDSDRQGFNGTLIASGLNPANVDATHGQYDWDTSSLVPGSQYFVYANVVRGGVVINQTYARWPIVKESVVVPTVSAIGPTQGTSSGGTTVTIHGTGFLTGASVILGGVAATDVAVVDSTTIRAITPAHPAATVDVVVVNPYVQSGTLRSGFTYVNASAALSLDPAALAFGGTTGGAVLTSSQPVRITVLGTDVVTWTASSDKPFIQVTPASGTGTGTITVSIAPGTSASGSGTVTVVGVGSTSYSPQTVAVTYTVYGAATSPAFGYFDTPVDGTTGVVGAIPVTGWALDDIEVSKVDIWRDPMVGEPVRPNGLVYIGDAIFVSGMRPDVEAAFPTYPKAYRAGWGYMLLTNFLPSGGNGTFRLHAYATDAEGHSTHLGARQITCDNAHATKPFGTIDTPPQGGAVSGTFLNWGWALTPQPSTIPLNGSTIMVYIDGAPVGHPAYNNYRSDIATLFPGYANSNGAVGYFYIDTTTLSNGVHTIMWQAIDNNGHAEGIGSRFFSVLN